MTFPFSLEYFLASNTILKTGSFLWIRFFLKNIFANMNDIKMDLKVKRLMETLSALFDEFSVIYT